jgi:hypothetical protein
MSAQIPETMLMSDLLKATGYDCPEELQDRTFAEATAGGDVQTNKASTIDVSAYTEPVVIKPDTDYESMKKNTVTLSNIPQTKTEIALNATENGEYTPDTGKVYNCVTVNVPQGATKLYAWKYTSVSNDFRLFTTSEQPQVGDHMLRTFNTGSLTYDTQVSEVVDDTHIKMMDGSTEQTLVRDSSKDITL